MNADLTAGATVAAIAAATAVTARSGMAPVCDASLAPAAALAAVCRGPRPWHAPCAPSGPPSRLPVSTVSSQVLGYGLPPALRSLVERHQTQRAQTTADRSLARRLRDAVRQAGLPPAGLSFYVHDGAISVYGTVSDAAARESVVAVAAGLPGVRRIVDHLKISA